MSDLMQDGAAMLRDSLNTHFSQTVTYWRGSKSITNLKATLGLTVFAVEDQGTGLATNWESQDFLVKPGDLVINSETIKPEVGDRIEWNSRTFEVLPPIGEAVKRRSGSYGYLTRIHTKEVGAC